MKALFITQVFYPDTVATGQVLWDLADYMQQHECTVTVFTSKYAYEDKSKEYLSDEIVNGVTIKRLWQTRLGKGNVLYRIIDFLSFNISVFFKLLFISSKKYDVIIGTTVPPFLSFIGVFISKIKKIPFCYYVMDLQPELSIQSGLIKDKSITEKFFTKLGNYSIRNSNKLISLDQFMTSYLIKRGAKPDNILTVPIWPLIDEKYSGDRNSNSFRIENDFGNKIVIMYSGNHAYVHPLDTLLEVANELKDDSRFLFVFVGGGVRRADVTDFKLKHRLDNILQLEFQPRNKTHISLASSDIQVVVMGNNLVGYTHPNKIYGALFVGKPILYIGPIPSHISEILTGLDGNISAQHGEVTIIINELIKFAALQKIDWDEVGQNNIDYCIGNFEPQKLKEKIRSFIIK